MKEVGVECPWGRAGGFGYSARHDRKQSRAARLARARKGGLGFAVQSDRLRVLRRTHAAERADGPREWDGFGSRPSSSVVAPQRDRFIRFRWIVDLGAAQPVASLTRLAYRQQFVTVTYWPYLVRNGIEMIASGIHHGNGPNQTPRWLEPGAHDALTHGE